MTYPVEHVRPTLEGDALEDCQHGEDEIVEVRDTEVGTLKNVFRKLIQNVFEV